MVFLDDLRAPIAPLLGHLDIQDTFRHYDRVGRYHDRLPCQHIQTQHQHVSTTSLYPLPSASTPPDYHIHEILFDSDIDTAGYNWNLHHSAYHFDHSLVDCSLEVGFRCRSGHWKMRLHHSDLHNPLNPEWS